MKMGITYSMPQQSPFERKCDEKLWIATARGWGGNVELAREAIEEGANVNFAKSKRFIFSNTIIPLWEAIKNSVDFGVKFLLKNGANPNYTDGQGISLLMYCAGAELPGITEGNAHSPRYCELLIKYGANVNQKSSSGLTALDYALRDFSDSETIDVLLGNGAVISDTTVEIVKSKLQEYGINYEKLKEILKIADERGVKIGINHALRAVMFEDFEVANKLISEKKFDENDMNALVYYSIFYDRLDTLRLLVNEGFLVESFLPCGKIVLTLAAECGKLDIVRYLVEEKGVNVDGMDPRKNCITKNYAISGAILNNHYEVAKYLIEKGATIRFVGIKKGDVIGTFHDTLLDALKSGNAKMIDLVLSSGYPSSDETKDEYKFVIQNFKNNSTEHLKALQHFVEKTNPKSTFFYTEMLKNVGMSRPINFEAIKWLIEKGANVNGHESKGYPHLLVWCCEENEIEIVKYLISKGADINASNGIALKNSTLRGQFNIVKFLVENGAKVDINIILKAEQAGSIRILEYLKSKIAK
jgi:ankyrin repeat protein